MTTYQLRLSLIATFILAAIAGRDTAAMTIWTGPRVTFTKADFADFNLPENQDRLTDNVWITRKNVQGIFNIRTETAFNNTAGSPADTEWAFGTTADLDALSFVDWPTWVTPPPGPPGTVGQDAVVHLISDDIFIDIRFLSWTSGRGGGGGGFSYERSTPAPMQVGDTNGDGQVNVVDLNAVRNNFGATGGDDGSLAGDTFPFDGNVNVTDLNSVRNNFGAGAVPEPAGLALTSMGLLALLSGVHRRRRVAAVSCAR